LIIEISKRWCTHWDWIFVTCDAVQFGWGRKARFNLHGRREVLLRLLLLVLLLSLLSPLCIVFTITYLRHTMFLRYTVLQLFCIYNLCYVQCYFAVKYVLYFYISTFRSLCAVHNTAVFCSSLISCFIIVIIIIIIIIIRIIIIRISHFSAFSWEPYTFPGI
jgi:hypothetical protein